MANLNYAEIALNNRTEEGAENLRVVASHLRELADHLDAVSRGEKSMAKMCQNQGFKYSRINNLIKNRADDTMDPENEKKLMNQALGAMGIKFPDEVFDAFTYSGCEQLYRAVYGLERVPSKLIFPPDLDKTVWTIMKKKLTDRERRVLIMRFGLNGGYPTTLDEIGKVFNVTRDRIRQIEAKALRHMRSEGNLLKYGIGYKNMLHDARMKERDKLLKEIIEEEHDKIYQEAYHYATSENKVVPYDPISIINQFTLDNLGLSVRAYNCLKRGAEDRWLSKITASSDHRMTWEEKRKKLIRDGYDYNMLVPYMVLTDEDLMKVRNLGRKSMEEVIQTFNAFLQEHIGMTRNEFLLYVDENGIKPKVGDSCNAV